MEHIQNELVCVYIGSNTSAPRRAIKTIKMVGNIMMQHINFFWRIYFKGRGKKRRWYVGKKNVKNKKTNTQKRGG
jgi:hypothetical protein